MTHGHHRHRERARRTERLTWHRRVGLSLALVFVFVVMTGLALNHAGQLGLHTRVIDADWLYRWYGMQPKGAPVGCSVNAAWVVELDATVFFNNRPVLDGMPLVGAVAAGDMIVVAAPSALALLAPDGALVERLTRETLPPGTIERLGTRGPEHEVVVQTGRGFQVFAPDFLTWSELPSADAASVVWSERVAPPAEVVTATLRAFRGEGLTVHRILMDIHSGRFFGSVGVWFVDLAALGLLFLALSGVWYAIAGRRSRG